MAYRFRNPIRFSDVDHAGIVYYPQFFHFYHVAFESFFSESFGEPYPSILDDRKIGFPTVHVEGDYRTPLRYGDTPEIVVTIDRVGNSSVTFRFRVVNGGDSGEPAVAEAAVTKACVDLVAMEPCPIPDDLRAHFEKHVVPPT